MFHLVRQVHARLRGTGPREPARALLDRSTAAACCSRSASSSSIRDANLPSFANICQHLEARSLLYRSQFLRVDMRFAVSSRDASTMSEKTGKRRRKIFQSLHDLRTLGPLQRLRICSLGFSGWFFQAFVLFGFQLLHRTNLKICSSSHNLTKFRWNFRTFPTFHWNTSRFGYFSLKISRH